MRRLFVISEKMCGHDHNTIKFTAPVEWMGHRPSLADSLPVIGGVQQHIGLWCAFGHDHLGLTGSAGTGQLLVQAMSGSAPAQKVLESFSLNRF